MSIPLEIIPGINEVESAAVQQKVEAVVGFMPWVHIDFADETFVPNKTCWDMELFREIAENVSLEAHLMVAHPEKYVKMLADAGFKRLIAHVEAVDPRVFLEMAQFESVEIGLALDGASELDLLEPYLDALDVALIMTVEAGPSGQPFLQETLEKIKLLRMNLPDLSIEVDGGINDKTAPLAVESGATRLVSTSFLFAHMSNVSGAVETLKQAIGP